MIYSLIVTVAGVLLASLLRGFTGFGFGLAAVPVLSLALPPASAVPLVVTLQVAIGALGFRQAARECDWRSIGMLTPGLIVGLPLGLLILTSFPPNPVRLAIGIAIAASVWMIHRGVRLPPNPSRLVSFGTGLLSGIISGLASMGGPPIIVYLLALGQSPARMRATSIVFFMVSGCIGFAMMAARGLMTHDVLTWAAASLPVMVLGSYLGTKAFQLAKPRHHRMVALVTLSLLATMLIARSLLR